MDKIEFEDVVKNGPKIKNIKDIYEITDFIEFAGPFVRFGLNKE